jgi:hypothetical protein
MKETNPFPSILFHFTSIFTQKRFKKNLLKMNPLDSNPNQPNFLVPSWPAARYVYDGVQKRLNVDHDYANYARLKITIAASDIGTSQRPTKSHIFTESFVDDGAKDITIIHS